MIMTRRRRRMFIITISLMEVYLLSSVFTHFLIFKICFTHIFVTCQCCPSFLSLFFLSSLYPLSFLPLLTSAYHASAVFMMNSIQMKRNPKKNFITGKIDRAKMEKGRNGRREGTHTYKESMDWM